MPKRPTILDVAAHAGVSKSTVSLVLQESALVKEDTRALVLASIAALGYVRNRAAATLRGSGSGLVGLVINDLRNPFFTEFAASAQRAFAERGFATVIADSEEDAAMQNRVVLSMLEHDVSALMLSPSYGDADATFEAIARAELPALQVLRRAQTPVAPLPFFSHDYEHGSELAAAHLLDQGLTRIAFVGGIADRPITAERMSGYVRQMRERGLAVTCLHGRPSRSFGRDAAHKLLAEQPEIDAAICFSDMAALGMAVGLAEAGRTVGRDFFLVGFDDIEEARLSYPPLTSVRCDVDRFGKEGAAMLLNWIETGTPPAAEQRLPVELMVRASSVRAG